MLSVQVAIFQVSLALALMSQPETLEFIGQVGRQNTVYYLSQAVSDLDSWTYGPVSLTIGILCRFQISKCRFCLD